MTAPSRHQLQRELQARNEAGRTTIAPGAALGLTVCFLALILSVPVIQILAGRQTGQPGFQLAQTAAEIRLAVSTAPTAIARIMTANRIVLQTLQTWEDDLEDASVVGQTVRPRLQYAFARLLGVGNEQVYIGRHRTLYYRPDLEMVTGPGFLDPNRLMIRSRAGEAFDERPQPDPRPAILAFHRALAQRDIQLILMPTPGKATVDPQTFTRRALPEKAPPRNIDFHRLMSELEKDGILVFDPAAIMTTGRQSAQDGAYLARDSHWRPVSMQTVAGALAEMIENLERLPAVSQPGWRLNPVEVTAAGDLAPMLDLPPGQTGFPPETVTIEQVMTAGDQFWRPDAEADVLLLGDSFSNIYSLEALGWGEAAGLAEHLSLALKRPLDRITRNDGGAHATRAMLASEMARGYDRLAGKRVLIWQFAERELFQGHWPIIAMQPGQLHRSQFVSPAVGQVIELRGIVQDIAPAPRPGTVLYRDHVVAMHLVDLEHPAPDIADGQALVYIYSMRDNRWTRAARLRRGETVRLRLSAWETVAGQVEAVNRAELDDWQLQLETPSWGEFSDE